MNICALATGQGGAIAIIRVSGPDAINIVDQHFLPTKTGTSLLHAKKQTLHYGHYITSGQTIDDILVSVFHAPHSYTGENSAEISCHASPYIITTILQTLIDSGCRQATPGEFTQRAYLNAKLDLAQAEAVADLIAANNSAAHRMALSQLKGAFSQQLTTLRQQLLHLTTLIELELDFADHEELQFADRTQLIQLSQNINDKIQTLAQTFQQGNAIKNGIPVAIVGAPNVGKSTLLNTLLNEEKAIVSNIPGTTRDHIEGTLNIKGHQFRIIDTAGLRHTNDQIETLGIQRTHKAAQEAQIIIMMNQPGVPFPEITTTPQQTIIHITNKTDTFQAINGTGVQQLQDQLADIAQQATNNPNSDIIISNIRHYEALTRAHQSLNNVLHALHNNTPTDLLAEDLRCTLAYLGEITGATITSQEVLNNIWSNFCIGK